MTIDATQIILAVIALLGAIVTGVVVPWLKTKIGTEQQAQLETWVKIAVEAAEQLYKGSGRGEEKLEYAVNWLSKRGAAFDEDTVRAAIEAAVLGLKEVK